MQSGDLVVAFNGKPIESSHDLPLLVSQTPVGNQANLEVIRKGAHKNFTVQIEELEKAERQITQIQKTEAELGLIARELSEQEADRMGAKGRKGVLVVRVLPGSQAEYVGIRTGDLILEVNDMPIGNLNDYNQALSRMRSGEIVRVFIQRGNMTSFYAFKK